MHLEIRANIINNTGMNGSLILCPEDPLSDFNDTHALETLLRELELISDGDDKRFYCGDRFPQLITFMGCSPHLVFAPPEDGSDNFCHVKILTRSAPQLLIGRQTAPPRCPGCRHRIADWKNYRDSWLENTVNAHWHCPKCENHYSPLQLDWRQSGGAAKTRVEVINIFPGEAVPVDSLLSALKEISGGQWRYFYLA